MGLPFEGIRVLDLSRVWAGPLATRILADLGAEVIKIEMAGDPGRGGTVIPDVVAKTLGIYPDGIAGKEPWNRQGSFIKFNRNKKSVTINLDGAAGRSLFKRLVAVSDIVIENYSPRVMVNFGLDYPALREVNPRIIMMSMPGYGMDGPYRDFVAYGTTLEPQAGLSSLMGYPDAGPYKSGVAFPDPVGALNGVVALLMALWHRRKSKEGQFIDLSQLEATTALIGQYITGFAMTGEVPKSLGNRHPYQAPHGCYPCQGEDRWLAISVGSDAEWRALCEVIGKPEIAAEARFADALNRWYHQDEIDEIITMWTRGQEHREAMHRLQEAGVAAGAVLDAAEMMSDPHLADQHFFWDVPHPAAGTYPYPGLPIHFTTFEPGVRSHSPLLGEHNAEIFTGLLGLDAAEIAQLEADGVIGIDPPAS